MLMKTAAKYVVFKIGGMIVCEHCVQDIPITFESVLFFLFKELIFKCNVCEYNA